MRKLSIGIVNFLVEIFNQLTKVPTPCIDDHLIPVEEFETKGVLAPVAARIVLMALFFARLARMDVMWTVNLLAREVTRWSAACDRRLHRLICFLHHTKDHGMVCFVGDRASECFLMLFSDASFAGDLRDSKSTSGGVLCLVGPNTFVPISWLCKKQGAVSHSTDEAEVISMDAGVRMEGLPALFFWDLVISVFEPQGDDKTSQFKGPYQPKFQPKELYDMFGCVDYVPPFLPIAYGMAKLSVMEDNDAVIKMCVKERSPALRHVSRTHRVDLDWLFDRIQRDPGVFIKFVPTKEQLADILAKGSFTAEAWNTLSKLCLILPKSTIKLQQKQHAKIATNTQASIAQAVSHAYFARAFATMASSMSNVDLAAREGMPDISEVGVSPSALAPREGERAENAPMQPLSIEESRARGWQAAWSKAIVWFLKVLPEGLQTARGMHATGEIDDDSMCSLGVNIFTEA